MNSSERIFLKFNKIVNGWHFRGVDLSARENETMSSSLLRNIRYRFLTRFSWVTDLPRCWNWGRKEFFMATQRKAIIVLTLDKRVHFIINFVSLSYMYTTPFYGRFWSPESPPPPLHEMSPVFAFVLECG